MIRKQQVLRRIRSQGFKLATVSGVLTTRPGMIEWIDRMVPEVQIITTKSYQVRPNPGYPEPVDFLGRYYLFVKQDSARAQHYYSKLVTLLPESNYAKQYLMQARRSEE